MANINVYRTDSLSSWRLKTNDLSNNVGDKVVLMTMKGHDQDSLRPLAGDVVEALMQVNMALTTEYLLDTTDKFDGELSFTTGSVIKGDDELSLKSAAGLGLYIHADGRIAINTQTPIAGYALTVTGNTYVSANTLLKGTLEVDSSSQFDGNVSITGTNTLTVNSGLSSFKGAMTVASNTNAGNVTIGNTTSNPTLTLVGTGKTTLGGALEVAANTLLKGTLEVDSSSQFDGNVSITGANTLTVNSGLAWFKGAMTVASNTNAGNVTIGNATSNPALTLVGTGKTTLGGAIDVAGNVDLGATNGLGTQTLTLRGTGKTTLGGAIDVAGNAEFGSGASTFQMLGTGASSFAGSLTVAGDSTLNGNVTIAADKDLTVTGGVDTAISLSGNTVAISGTAVTGTPITVTGNTSIGVDGGTQTLTLLGTGKTTLGGALEVAGTTLLKSKLTVNTDIDSEFKGNISQTGAYTFSTGTGAVSLNGNVTIAADKLSTFNGGITQSGTNTFSTGTGAVSLNGNVTIAANKDLTVTGGVDTAISLSGNTVAISGTAVAGTPITVTGNTSITGTTSLIGNTSIGAADETGTQTLTLLGTGATTLGGALTVTGITNLNNTVNVKNGQTVNIGTTGLDTTTTNIRGFLNVTENVNLDAALTVFADTEFETGNVAITAGTFTSYGTTTLGNIVTNPTLTLLGTGTTTLGGALTVAAASTLNGNVAITGTKTLTVGTGATSLGGTLDVDGVSTFESASYFNEDVTIGSAIANKILTVYGTMIIDGGITSVAGSTGQGYELLSGINYDALNSNPTPTYDAYFQVDRYTSNPARLYWNESTDKWQADNGTTRSDIITAHNFATTVNSASISAFKTHIKKQRYTATTNQTVFNLSSKCDQLDQCTEVFVNGILMEITDDYVITNANTITFTSGVPSGNKVMIKYNTWGITQ